MSLSLVSTFEIVRAAFNYYSNAIYFLMFGGLPLWSTSFATLIIRQASLTHQKFKLYQEPRSIAGLADYIAFGYYNSYGHAPQD